MANQSTALQEVSKPHYGYWQALYMAFFSSKLYVDVVKRWKGLGLLYFLLLIFVSATPFALRLSYDFNQFFAHKFFVPIQNMPPIMIQNGKASFDKPMPHLIRDAEGRVVTIIDTTGKIKTRTPEYPDLSVLVTQDKLTFWPPMVSVFFIKDSASPAQPIAYTFDPHMNQVLDGPQWLELSGIEKIKYLALLLVYPMVILLFYFIFIGFLLAFALMGQLLSKLFFQVNLSYTQSSRLLVVASTVPIFIFMFAFALNWLFLGFGLIMVGLLAVYFSYGALAVHRASKKVVRL